MNQKVKPIRDKKYQASHHEQPCSFAFMGGCSSQETNVGHHLKIAGLKSLNSKNCDAMALPACSNHHTMCDDEVIGKEIQRVVWAAYILERLTQKYGIMKAMQMLSGAYWELLDE